jgi:hypothetical protein
MTVAELNVIMPLSELFDWMAFFSIENDLEAQRQAQARADRNIAKMKGRKSKVKRG